MEGAYLGTKVRIAAWATRQHQHHSINIYLSIKQLTNALMPRESNPHEPSCSWISAMIVWISLVVDVVVVVAAAALSFARACCHAGSRSRCSCCIDSDSYAHRYVVHREVKSATQRSLELDHRWAVECSWTRAHTWGRSRASAAYATMVSARSLNGVSSSLMIATM